MDQRVPHASGPDVITAERLEQFSGTDLHDLCDAAAAAIDDGGGFGWLVAPRRDVFERYWSGVVLVPERTLFVGRVDGTIGGAAQLQRPPRNNEAQAHVATLTGMFVAPWARGRGMARAIVLAIEAGAREAGFKVINLDVRETQVNAIKLYEALGYHRWATHPHYAIVDGRMITGHYFTKLLSDTP
jgi:ribosomal protein S18 acetylase RimI-like enzyme